MSFLDILTISQKETLISLPYRAGLWVSQSDESGGSAADEEELQVLSNILHGFTHEIFGSETMQYIMRETVARQDQWESWGADLSSVLDDCAIAVDVLILHTDPKDVHAFQNHIMEIGQAVALAFREYDEAGAVEKLSLWLSYNLGQFKAMLFKKPHVPKQEFFNISGSERKALWALSNALGVNKI